MPVKSSQEPSLGRLRRRARVLVRQHQAHDPAVADILRAYHPAFADLTIDEIFNKPLQLSDAQFVLARQQGQPMWPQNSFSQASPVGKPRVILELIPRPEYRRELAARRGLPPIGTRKISRHGVDYEVIDHAFVLSHAGVVRANDEPPVPHIDELLSQISFPAMSPSLRNLYDEVNCCTSKHLLFFDTMPDKFPRQAAPGVHAVHTTQDPRCLTFHFDASRLHETIIAHELGHLWIELVEGCEDWRNLRDQSDITKVVQFQHIQSFVLDLKVNDLIQSHGFDMSVINNDQLESIREMAYHCAEGEQPKTMRAAAGMANTLAAGMLEQKRWPKSVLPNFQDCLAIIQLGQPKLYRLAEQFVASVKRHGYADRVAICRVIDECATLSFQATGDEFTPARDLVEELPSEWMQDKHPDFMPDFPVATKLDVFRTAALHGIGPRIGCHVIANPSGRVAIKIFDLSGQSTATPEVVCDLPPHTMEQIFPQLQRQPRQQPVVPSPSISPHYVPTNILLTMATPLLSIASSIPWQPVYSQAGQHGFSSGRNYMAGVGLWLSRAGFEEQRAGEHPYGYAGNNPVNFIDPDGAKPTRGPKPSKLRPCPIGWEEGKGSVTKCNEPNMGMKTMYCQYCPKGGKATCSCDSLSALTGGQFVAIKGSKLVCGATLKLMNRMTGETKTVTVIDEGPYANGAIIDISEAVFGVPQASTWPVCVGPISQPRSPVGWRVCQKG